MHVCNILHDTVQYHTDLSDKSNTIEKHVELNIREVTYSGNTAASTKLREEAAYIT
jgi:hypothetical protein